MPMAARVDWAARVVQVGAHRQAQPPVAVQAEVRVPHGQAAVAVAVAPLLEIRASQARFTSSDLGTRQQRLPIRLIRSTSSSFTAVRSATWSFEHSKLKIDGLGPIWGSI
jgi:hypothetical protein